MSSPSIAPGRQLLLSRAIPMTWVLLLAMAINGPLLMLQVPNYSHNANLHKFFASHYAQRWFDPWNEKWFTGFSQTTLPPLAHQWTAFFSRFISLNLAYMLTQLIGILLVVIGVYRYSRIWLGERGASYAALGSIFLGSMALLVYSEGDLPTVCAAGLFLNALPYFYAWSRASKWTSLLKGIFLAVAAAATQLSTVTFGTLLFGLPVLVTAIIDRRRDERETSGAAVLVRAIFFAAVAAAGIAVVLWPFLKQPSIPQMSLPNPSRENYFTNFDTLITYWILPWGAIILALPFIFSRGLRESRYLPLFLGLWVTLIFGLGGTTILTKMVLGDRYDLTDFQHFNFWATLMSLPLVAILAVQLINRHGQKAIISLGMLAALTFGFAMGWPAFHPDTDTMLNSGEISSFMNRDGHDTYRYLTLGFGSKVSEVGTDTIASSIDGEYSPGRLLPELIPYGSLQLTNARYYGAKGMEALKAVLKHADQYGLRYIFVRDPYYAPLLAFAGWRTEEIYDQGIVILWVKDGVPPAHPNDYAGKPTTMDGLMWGTLPFGSSLMALLLVLVLPERRRQLEAIEFPVITSEEPLLKEAR